MKKLIAFVVCTILLVCAFSVSVFAEGESVDSIETNVEAETTLPTADETATESEISVDKTMPDITTELIVGYIKDHFEEISVIVSLLLTAFYNIRKHKQLNQSISATNKNAIAVAENSDLAIQNALTTINGILQEKEAEKHRLEQTLHKAVNYIKTSKLANIEFANELAELLVLANIPNSKKDELYSRHIAAVNAIAEAEKTEVNTDDDGKET